MESPCLKCPFKDNVKVPPSLPRGRKLTVLGLAPGDVEEQVGENFRGPAGKLLREALSQAGLDHKRDVGYVDMTRCKPPNNEFNAKWKRAAKLCSAFVEEDLRSAKQEPLLAVGNDPYKYLVGSKRQITKARGIWYSRLGDPERPVFVSVHPSYVLRSRWKGDEDEKQFFSDIARAAARVLGNTSQPLIKYHVIQSYDRAVVALAWLSRYAGPWAFDIEAYDDAAVPSRDGVATNPFHADFRVRGLAVAWRKDRGMYFEFARCTANGLRQADFVRHLSAAFDSKSEKYAFNGGYDENGLIVPGWIKRVRNRTGDAMLSAIALGDGRIASNDLSRVETAILGWPEHWGVDKKMMRVLPLPKVAEGCVRDACVTFAAEQYLRARMKKGKYLHPNMTKHGPTVPYTAKEDQ